MLTQQWAQRLAGRVVGIDLEDPVIQAEWEKRRAPNLEYRVMKAENLPFADDEFDMACAIEVLEHVPDPEHTVAEMARVASGHLLVSVPREPLWRGLNMARGAYLRDLGNTPGHVNHWSKRAFVELLSRHGEVVEARSPFPWTMLLVARRETRSFDVAAKRRGYGRGASILSIGIATTGVVTFAYFSLASHNLSEVDYKSISLLWSVLFLIISIIYRPVEQLLSHTISSRRAQGHEAHPLRVAFTIQMSAAALFLVVALAFKEPLVNDVFDGSEALYWVLVVAVLAYAASYFARGWLAGHQWFGLYGGLVLLESVSRCMFALAVALGIASGQTAVALGIAAAPLVSLAVVPVALSAPRRPRHDLGARRDARGRGLRRRGAGDHGRRAGAAQRPGAGGRRDRDRRRARRLRVQRAADHARAAAALPGDPDVAPPPPLRPARNRRGRRLRPRDPDDDRWRSRASRAPSCSASG